MKNRLDKTLKDWSGTHKPTEKQLTKLSSRISGKLPYAIANAAVLNEYAVSPRMRIFTRLAYASLGAVAALVILISIPREIEQTVEFSSSMDQTHALAGIPCDRISNGLQLFDEMNRLFNGNLRWVAESNGDMGMGVETTEAHGKGNPALVRITVLARNIGEAAWTTAWRSDVLLRGQDMVEVAPNADSANKLSLWIFPLEDGKIAIDTTISLNLCDQLATQFSNIIAPGEIIELATSRHNNTEYRILQTVVLLNEEV